MSSFLQEIELGKRGGRTGLKNCFDRFNQFLCNTQKGVYYAIGGLPGTGKSALTDANFVLEPYFHYRKNKGDLLNIEWFYYSFEISRHAKQAKWTAYKLYKDYGILTDSNEILSRGQHRISQEVYEKVVEVHEYMEEMFSHIHFVDEPQTPGQIYHELLKYAEDNGTFEYETYTDSNNILQSRKSGYKPHNINKTVVIVVDHVGLTKIPKGLNKKDTIDQLSSQMRYFRNLCSYVPVVVSQFNRSLTAIDRQKYKAADLAPTLEDFKDSGNIGEDCNVAMGVFNPHKLDIKKYLGYDTATLKNNFRAVNIMKNRDGADWVNIGMQFIGEMGHFKELPTPMEFELGNYTESQFVVTKTNNKP